MTVWYACVACNRELYNERQEYCAECWNAQRLRPDAYERELDRLYAQQLGVPVPAEGDKSMRKWAIRATREELYQKKIGEAFDVHEETEIVALFSTEAAARRYIKKATLKNPQPRRGFEPAKVFRKTSLLWRYDYAEVEPWGEPDYPLDPEI